MLHPTYIIECGTFWYSEVFLHTRLFILAFVSISCWIFQAPKELWNVELYLLKVHERLFLEDENWH